MMQTRRGAAALEFALTMPVLFSVFMGIIELSFYIDAFHQVSRAARDGARVGSITLEGPSPTGDDIEAAAVAQATAVLTGSGLSCDSGCDITADWAQDTTDGFYYLDVQVLYPTHSITGLMPVLERGITARFTMLTQQQ